MQGDRLPEEDEKDETTNQIILWELAIATPYYNIRGEEQVILFDQLSHFSLSHLHTQYTSLLPLTTTQPHHELLNVLTLLYSTGPM